MRITGIIMIAVVLASQLLLAENTSGQVLNKRLDLSYNHTDAYTVLRDIEQKTSVNFAFTDHLDLERIIVQDVHFRHERVYDILNFLFENNHIGFEEQSGTIMLYKIQAPGRLIGRITDENHVPLAGATIRIAETGRSYSADAEGKFSINVRRGTYTLEISYLSYQQVRRQVTVEDDQEISLDIVLAEAVGDLDEVVVVGYGVQRKSDITGAVGSVRGETLEKYAVTNVEQALSGRIPGVDVSVNSGQPGGTPRIQIRGATSVSNTNDPLYVVDGVMLNVERLAGSTHSINFIDPSNIESIEVLKDASATAIYGARGANGVVLITTKKGSRDGGHVAYQGYTSFGDVTRRLDLMNADEFLTVEDIAYQNAEKFDPTGFGRGQYEDPLVKRRRFVIGNTLGNPELFDESLAPLYDTDWQDEAFQTTVTQNHNLSFTGGDQNTTFGLFLTYRDEDGAVKGSWLDRYSARFSFESKLKPWLTAGGGINYNKQRERLLEGWTLRSIFQNIPIMPVKYPDGTWADTEIYPGVESPNQQQYAAEDNRLRGTQDILGNIYAMVHFTPKLYWKTMVATNSIRQEMKNYAGKDVPKLSETQGGIASLSALTAETWQFENLLNYQNTFGEAHRLDAILGQSLLTSNRFSNNSTTWGFLDDYYQYNNLGTGSNPRPSGSSASKYSMASFFGRVNYSLHDKYLLTATGRFDGSSKFGKSHRYGFFPSVALGWMVSEENFLKDHRTISNLKLRTSYGLTGNSEIANYQYEAGLGSYAAVFGNSRAVGIGLSGLANSDLKWETNKQFDIGIELSLFNNRLNVEMDLYRRVSTDMLLNRPVPRSSGFATVYQNIGNMGNKGLELALSAYPVQRASFSWRTDLNWSLNRNEVLKLHDGADILLGTAAGSSTGSIIREGLPVNSFLGFVRLGTWSNDEADEAARYNRRPGDIKFQDTNGDGAITTDDQVILGKGLPDGYGSFVNTLTYGNFDLSLDIQFQYGNKVMWEMMAVLEDRTGAYNNMLRSVKNAWTPENQHTVIAQSKPLAVGYDTKNDTHRLKDGSFIRGRNLMLGYNFPSRWISARHIQSLRVYAATQNFFLISDYPGYDPEVSSFSEEFSRGRASYGDYPKPRLFVLGLNITL